MKFSSLLQLKSYQGLSSLSWQGIFLSLIEASLIGICYFLSLYFVKILNFSVFHAGLLISAYGIGTIIGGHFSGKLSDLFMPEKVRVISLFLQSIAFFLLSKVASPIALIIVLITLGMGSYGFVTSNHLCVLFHCSQGEDQRLKAINLLEVSSNLGLSISALFISLLPLNTFTFLFKIISLILSVIAILLFFQIRKHNYTHPLTASTPQAPIMPLWKPNQIIIYILTSLFFVGLIISQMNSNYPLYLQHLFPEMGTKSFGLLFMLNSMLIVLLQAPIVNAFSSFNKILLSGIGAFLLGLGMMMLNFSFHFSVAVLACLIFTLGEMLFFSVAQLICYESAAPNNKGKSLGNYRMVYASSRVVGPAVGSFVFLHSEMTLWYGCGIIGFCCLLASYVMSSTWLMTTSAEMTKKLQ